MGLKRSFESFLEFSLEQQKQLVSGSKACFASESFDKDTQISKKSNLEHKKLPDFDDKLTLFAKPFDAEELQVSSMTSSVKAKQLVDLPKQLLPNQSVLLTYPCNEGFQGPVTCYSFNQEKYGTYSSNLTSSAKSLEEEHEVVSPWREVKEVVLDTRFDSLVDDEDSCSHETSQANGDLSRTHHALVRQGEVNVDLNKPHWNEEHGNMYNRDDVSHVSGDKLDSVLTSQVTSSSGVDDVISGDAFFSSSFSGYFDFNVRSRSVAPPEDTYSSLLKSSPRKQVPIGVDHQADIPQLVQKTDKNDDHLMGTCIISFESNVCTEIAKGRSFCGCFDKGSITCVRIHVKEAREKLKKEIGGEKYERLGFCKMGEEVVANEWTDEEERFFHEVVYSNPASRGRNFWNVLSMVFPCRSKMELVSYYFNVFILQRRAVQNRSMLLEIDSDDDEWSGNGDFRVIEEHEDEEEDEDEDEDEDSDVEVENDDENNNEVDICVGDEYHMPTSYDHKKLYFSSESKSNTMESSGGGGGSVGARVSDIEEDYFTRQWLGGESNGSNDSFLYDSFDDTKVWDMTSCSTGFPKGVDILPTCSMIDEIFGPFTPKRDQVN